MSLVARYALASVMLVVIAETAKRSARLGALIAALPLVTIITVVVLYSGGEKTESAEGRSVVRRDVHAVSVGRRACMRSWLYVCARTGHAGVRMNTYRVFTRMRAHLLKVYMQVLFACGSIGP